MKIVCGANVLLNDKKLYENIEGFHLECLMCGKNLLYCEDKEKSKNMAVKDGWIATERGEVCSKSCLEDLEGMLC